MKVLQITTNYPCIENPIFGIFVKEQVESVEKYGVENTIIFSNGLKSNPKIKFSASFIHLRTALKLLLHLQKHKYDVIHCHNVLAGLILKIAHGFGKQNTVLSLQNDPEFEGTADSKFTSKVYPQFSKIIVKKRLKNPRDKYVYLPNGVNMELFQPMDKMKCKQKLGLDPNKRYILFVDANTFRARTQKRKDRFDETLKILKDKYGHSDLQELVMTKALRHEVPYWMNACELYLLSSDEEGSPNAVKECMACNVPVVATPVGNIPDLFDGVKGCMMVNSFNPEEMAKATDAVLRSKDRSDIRSKIYEKELDMDSIANKLYELYKELCDNETK